MKLRWMGITGLVLVLAALVGGSLGPSLWPRAFWSGHSSPMMGQGMMSGGMMNGGMMGPGMMSGGMMGTVTLSDSNAPFDQRFLNQMIMHHQGGHCFESCRRPGATFATMPRRAGPISRSAMPSTACT